VVGPSMRLISAATQQCGVVGPFTRPMTLGDLEGHWPVAGLIKCNLTNISATFRMVQMTLHVACSLGNS